MASLDPTERAKVALAAGESLRVTTAGQCTVQGLTGAPATTTTLTANSQNFGPYGVSAVLLITGVTGRSEYSLNVPAASGGAVPGDGISGMPQTVRLEALGHSILADARNMPANEEWWTNWGWLTWARRYLGQTVFFPLSSMYAVGGNTVQQVIDNQLPQVSAGSANITILDAWINSLDAESVESMQTKALGIIDTLRGQGKTVLAMCMRAKGSGAPFTTDQTRRLCAFNSWLKNYATTVTGLWVFDPNPLYIDFSTGHASTTLLRDNLHDAMPGAMRLGKAVADYIRAKLDPVDQGLIHLNDTYDAVFNPTGNLLANGLLAGTGGTLTNGATGTPPTSWRGLRSTGAATHTCVFSSGTDTTYPTLPVCVMTFGGTQDANSSAIDQQFTTAGLVVPGETIELTCEVEWDFTNGARGLELKASCWGSGPVTAKIGADGFMSATNGRMPAGTGSCTLQSARVVAQENMNTIQAKFTVYPLDNAAPTGVVRVKRMTMRKVLPAVAA